MGWCVAGEIGREACNIMAYNTVAIKKDVDNKPIPQYYNPLVDQYEALQGRNGAQRVELFDANGNAIDLVGLINAIITILNGTATVEKQDEIKTIINNIYNKDTTRTYYGTSSDTKPTTGLNKGDAFFEIDTKTVYMWDGTNWVVI